jgi:hypothetical protein
MQAITIDLDIAKSVFQVHGVDAQDKVVIRRQLKRRQVSPFFKKLPPCLIGIEACVHKNHKPLLRKCVQVLGPPREKERGPNSAPTHARSAPRRKFSRASVADVRGCTADKAAQRVMCPAMEAELARSRQGEKLKIEMAHAEAELAKIQPAKVANSDAKALARYTAALGFDIGPDRLNDLLVLLAVLGASFGWSKTRMNEVLHELQAAGRVRLSVTRQGTAVRLVAA